MEAWEIYQQMECCEDLQTGGDTPHLFRNLMAIFYFGKQMLKVKGKGKFVKKY